MRLTVPNLSGPKLSGRKFGKSVMRRSGEISLVCSLPRNLSPFSRRSKAPVMFTPGIRTQASDMNKLIVALKFRKEKTRLAPMKNSVFNIRLSIAEIFTCSRVVDGNRSIRVEGVKAVVCMLPVVSPAVVVNSLSKSMPSAVPWVSSSIH